MNTKRKKTGRKLLAFLLTLAMVVGLMPGMSLTAYAAGEKAYAAYDVTTETNKTKSGNDLTYASCWSCRSRNRRCASCWSWSWCRSCCCAMRWMCW